MISDVLADAVAGMNEYLKDHEYRDIYEGDLRKELKALRNLMEAMRARLDAPVPVHCVKTKRL